MKCNECLPKYNALPAHIKESAGESLKTIIMCSNFGCEFFIATLKPSLARRKPIICKRCPQHCFDDDDEYEGE